MGSFEGSVIVPCATPFVAGPGAITLVITIASSTSGWEGPIAALVAVAIAVALLPIGHLYLANKINLSEQAMKVLTKFGGQVLRAVVGRLLAALSSRVKQRGRCSARRWNGASSTP
jgi:multiple antibiotic resistance protein